MAQQNLMESELAVMIVEVLELDIVPEHIPSLDSLFGGGLGLDSIDALEISLEIERRYGIVIKGKDHDREIFQSLSTLAEYVARYKKS